MSEQLEKLYILLLIAAIENKTIEEVLREMEAEKEEKKEVPDGLE